MRLNSVTDPSSWKQLSKEYNQLHSRHEKWREAEEMRNADGVELRWLMKVNSFIVGSGMLLFEFSLFDTQPDTEESLQPVLVTFIIGW